MRAAAAGSAEGPDHSAMDSASASVRKNLFERSLVYLDTSSSTKPNLAKSTASFVTAGVRNYKSRAKMIFDLPSGRVDTRFSPPRDVAAPDFRPRPQAARSDFGRYGRCFLGDPTFSQGVRCAVGFTRADENHFCFYTLFVFDPSLRTCLASSVS